MDVTLSDDLKQTLAEFIEDLEKRQIAQTRVLSKILKELQSISADVCGVKFEHGELANLLCSMASDFRDFRELLGVPVEHPVEKEDT